MYGLSGADISFVPITRADFGLIGEWLDEPLVHRWWHDDSSPAGVEKEYGGVVDGREAGQVYIAHHAGRPFGLIQRYPIAAYPEYLEEFAPVYELPPGALGLDYFVADPALRGQGLGSVMIARFVADSWAAFPDAHAVIVAVVAGNRSSWRALERAGFRRVAEVDLTPDNPVDPPAHVVYRMDRPIG